jgi:hypothetical protein
MYFFVNPRPINSTVGAWDYDPKKHVGTPHKNGTTRRPVEEPQGGKGAAEAPGPVMLINWHILVVVSFSFCGAFSATRFRNGSGGAGSAPAHAADRMPLIGATVIGSCGGGKGVKRKGAGAVGNVAMKLGPGILLDASGVASATDEHGTALTGNPNPDSVVWMDHVFITVDNIRYASVPPSGRCYSRTKNDPMGVPWGFIEKLARDGRCLTHVPGLGQCGWSCAALNLGMTVVEFKDRAIRAIQTDDRDYFRYLGGGSKCYDELNKEVEKEVKIMEERMVKSQTGNHMCPQEGWFSFDSGCRAIAAVAGGGCRVFLLRPSTGWSLHLVTVVDEGEHELVVCLQCTRIISMDANIPVLTPPFAVVENVWR